MIIIITYLIIFKFFYYYSFFSFFFCCWKKKVFFCRSRRPSSSSGKKKTISFARRRFSSCPRRRFSSRTRRPPVLVGRLGGRVHHSGVMDVTWAEPRPSSGVMDEVHPSTVNFSKEVVLATTSYQLQDCIDSDCKLTGLHKPPLTSSQATEVKEY